MNAASAAKLGGALLLGSVVAFLVGAKPIPAVTEPAPPGRVTVTVRRLFDAEYDAATL